MIHFFTAQSQDLKKCIPSQYTFTGLIEFKKASCYSVPVEVSVMSELTLSWAAARVNAFLTQDQVWQIEDRYHPEKYQKSKPQPPYTHSGICALYPGIDTSQIFHKYC